MSILNSVHRHLAVLAAVSLILASRLSAQMIVVPTNIRGIDIRPFVRTSDARFAPVFAQDAVAGTERASVVISNNTDRNVVAMSVVWCFKQYDGKELKRALKSDSFGHWNTPAVLAPHSQLLATPVVFVPERILGCVTLTSNSHEHGFSDLLQTSASVAIELDLVVFENGDYSGNDVRGYVRELQARKSAANSVVALVRSTEASGGSVPDALALVSQGVRVDDPQSVWKARLAKRLSSTRNFTGELERLEQMPALPVFRKLK